MLDDSQLEKLLTDVDAHYVPVASTDLARRVRDRAHRRRTVKRVVAAGAVICVVAIAVVIRLMPPHSTTQVVSDPKPAPADTAKLREEYARLNAEADAHAQAANVLIAAERSTTPFANHGDVARDPLLDIRNQRDRGARALLRFGDSISTDASSRLVAESAYRQAVSVSPESDAAAQAKKRLAEFGA